MKVSIVFEFFDQAFVVTLGANKLEPDDAPEIEHVEMSSQTERAQYGFRPNDEDDEWEDRS